VDSKTLRLVARLVHADADGHLAVVAVPLRDGKRESADRWTNIPPETEKPLDIPSVSIQVHDLLPNKRDYFTYAGRSQLPLAVKGYPGLS
jgi:carbonic anhydrase